MSAVVRFRDGGKSYAAWITSDEPRQVVRLRVTNFVTSWRSRHRRLISRELPLPGGRRTRKLAQLALGLAQRGAA